MPLVKAKKAVRLTVEEEPVDRPYDLDVVFFHDVEDPGRQKQLEALIKSACEGGNEPSSGAARKAFHIRNFRLSPESIRERDLAQECWRRIDSRPRFQKGFQSPPANQPIVLITYELGAWPVREFVTDMVAGLSIGAGLEQAMLDRLIGIIFLGANVHKLAFDYLYYLKKHFSDGLGASNAAPDSNSNDSDVRHPVTTGTAERLASRLYLIDRAFADILETPGVSLASRIWILPSPRLTPGQQSVKRVNSINQTSISQKAKEWTLELLKPNAKKGSSSQLDQKAPPVITDENKSGQPATTPDDCFTSLKSKVSFLKSLKSPEDLQNVSSPEKSKDLFIDIYAPLRRKGLSTTDLESVGSQASPYPSTTMGRMAQAVDHRNLGERSEGSSTPSTGRRVMIETPRIQPQSPQDPAPRVADYAESHPGSLTTHGTVPFDDPVLASHSGISAMIPDTSSVDDKTRGEIQVWIESARQHLNETDFDRAERHYERCLERLERLGKSKRPPDLYTSILTGKALVKLQRGRYREARTSLEILRKEPRDVNLPAHLSKIDYHLCEISMIEGEYGKAFQCLNNLRDSPQSKEVHRRLLEKELPSDWTDKILDLEVFLDTIRLSALLAAQYGRFDEAESELATAATHCAWLLSTTTGPALSMAVDALRARIYLTLLPISILEGKQNLDLTRFATIPKVTKDGPTWLEMLAVLEGKQQGNGVDCLELASSTLQAFEKLFGPKHILTLQAVVFRATIASKMCDRRAAAICKEAIDWVFNRLGREHPLAMEALSALVNVFSQDDRIYEAHDTISALVDQASRRLGEDHPQTLAYRLKLGQASLNLGNYLEAERTLQDAYDRVRAKIQPEMPVHLVPGSLTSLANANYASLRLDTAQENIRKALEEHLKMWKRNNSHPGPKTGVAELLSGWIRGSSQVPRAESVVTPHPDVLNTLRIYADICREAEVGPDDPAGIYELVYEKSVEWLGETHLDTLRNAVSLGYCYLVTLTTPRLGRDFHRVTLNRCAERLGLNHRLTLVAKMTSSLSGDLDKNPSKVISDMVSVVAGLTRRFGAHHPITLEVLSILFTLQLFQDDESAADTAAQLLRQLRQTKAREQRLIPSLEVELKVATLYCEKDQYVQGLAILKAIKEFLEEMGKRVESSRADEGLEKFKKYFEERYQGFQEQAENIFRNKLEKSSRRCGNDPESDIRSCVALSKVMYGEEDFRTHGALFGLAKILEDTTDVEKTTERMEILGQLVHAAENAHEQDEGEESPNNEAPLTETRDGSHKSQEGGKIKLYQGILDYINHLYDSGYR